MRLRGQMLEGSLFDCDDNVTQAYRVWGGDAPQERLSFEGAIGREGDQEETRVVWSIKNVMSYFL